MIENPVLVQNAREQLRDYEYDNSSIVSTIESVL